MHIRTNRRAAGVDQEGGATGSHRSRCAHRARSRKAALAAFALTGMLAAALSAGCAGDSGKAAVKLDPSNPTTITVWDYYNGAQQASFDSLVSEFNSTVGKEKNIRVESSSQGSVNDLETSVLAAAEGKVGAEKLPNIVSSYADTAFTLDQMGLAVDLSPYLTEKEKSDYIAGFLEEGDLMNNGELKVFPIAKSTELLYLNVTDFVPFAEATGVTYADLSTVEGLNEAAHKY